MPRAAPFVPLLALLAIAGGCTSRRAAPPEPIRAAAPPRAEPSGRPLAEIKAGLAASKKRTPHIAMPTDEEAHKAMPSLYKGRPMPYLALVGSLTPKTMEALLATAKTMRREGGLDNAFLNDVFWVVSNANDCFY